MSDRGKLHYLVLLLAAALPACGTDGPTDTQPDPSVQLTFSQLQPLSGGHFEAWISTPDTSALASSQGVRSAPFDALRFISLGKFRIDGRGVLSAIDSSRVKWTKPSPADLASMTEAWVSMEPAGDSDATPRSLILGGTPFRQGDGTTIIPLDLDFRGILSAEHDPSLARLDTLRGYFVLETPSDTISDNEAYGIYFRNGNKAGLGLPALGDVGLEYESWVVRTFGGGAVSMGRFRNPDSIDSDGAGYGAGAAAARFPGQEFTSAFRLTLNNGDSRIQVTLEPRDDWDLARPTGLVLFDDAVPAAWPPRNVKAMDNVAATLPSGILALRP